MKRVIFDTQSNELFRGSSLEQDYDQRGGLCQVGKGHIVVTTNPIDSAYLKYWRSLGFSVPHLIVAGPYQREYTLSELVINKKEIQNEVKKLIGTCTARLEFYWIGESEKLLSQVLGIPAYCNFKVSTELSQKITFKKLCHRLEILTPEWFYHKKKERLLFECRSLVKSGSGFLVKFNDGTGGLPCGGMFKIDTAADLEKAEHRISKAETEFFIEEIVDNLNTVVSIHWEIDDSQQIKLIGIFKHLTRHFSYDGISYPAEIADPVCAYLISVLQEKLGPHLVREGGRGYFHCDVIVDENGDTFWIDFNPRKGGGLYIWDMVWRLSKIHFNSATCNFWNEHIQISQTEDRLHFEDIYGKISTLLTPGKRSFLVVTNPGVIGHGYVDLTGISTDSKRKAKGIVKKAQNKLL